MSAAKEDKYTLMTTCPVERLVCRMAVPTIISMLVTGLYNIVDTFFVGRIGNEATAGVGLILPIMAIIQAFGFFFGQGSGNYISRSLGAKHIEKAEAMAATGSISALIFGVVLMAVGFVFKNGVLFILGAREGLLDPLTIRYAEEYMCIILCGAPFMCVSCVLNQQLRFQGNAVFSMVGLVSGAVLNCVLDPIFIFTLGMDVKGAALATVVGQTVSCLMLYAGTLRSDSLKIHIKNFSPTAFYYKNIFVGGLPSLIRQSLSSVSVMCLNSAAAAAATAALAAQTVAAFTVVNKITMLAFSALLGFGQGFQPICGFNYGAKRFGRVRGGYLFCLKVSFVFLIIMSALGYALAPGAVALFRDDADVIRIGTTVMRCQCATFWLVGLVVTTNMVYQNLGRVIGGAVLAMARNGLYFIPAVLILPQVMSVPIWGVYIAQPVADVCAFLTALPLAVHVCRDLKQKQAEQEAAEAAGKSEVM